MRKVIPFADWLPDQPDLGNKGITAKNVIPWKTGYKKFPAYSAYSTALTARFQGGCFARDKDSNVYNYSGDATKLYRLSGTTQTDASRLAGGAYSTASDDWWEFAQWGETVIATNYADAPQVITMGSANFAALSGSPPKARHIAVVRDFVVLGNVNDGTKYTNRVQWSGINDSTSWAVSAATQADYQDLQGDGGWIQKIVGGEFGLVFQERAIWRMTYVGSPVIFQFDLVERARGTFAPQSVVAWGNMVFFLSDDGFYAMVGGAPAQPIGDGKVDRYFLNDYQSAALSYSRITGTIDPVNKLVMWSYPGSGSASSTPNKILCYNWVYGKWSIIEQEIEGFVRYAASGYTLDSLDSLSGSIDALTTSLDSRAYTGGSMSLAGYNTSHKLGTFTGTAMAATVDTGEVELNPGYRTMITELTPLVDGLSVSISIRERNNLYDTATYGTATAQNAYGVVPAISNARYHAFRCTTSGDFNFIQGLEVDHSAAETY